jgi:nucleoside-diphosphate-sugar epimerase
MKLLVTGASGFVARHLLDEVARRRIPARALSRRPPSDLAPGVEAVLVPSFDDTAALERACAGCTAVVHLAGRAHVMRDRASDPLAEFRRANVDATRALLAAAERCGVRRLVLASTVKVHGEGREQPYTSQDPPHPADPYAISKAEAEAVLLDPTVRLEPVVLRPPLVYGPGARGNFARLVSLARVARVVPVPLGGLTNRRSLVYVGNLVDALLHVVAAPDAAGRAFLVSDGEDLSTSELIRRIGGASGFTPRLVAVPEPLLRAVGRAFGAGATIERLVGSLTVDPSLLLATGWTPPFTVDDGLATTAARWTSRRG